MIDGRGEIQNSTAGENPNSGLTKTTFRADEKVLKPEGCPTSTPTLFIERNLCDVSFFSFYCYFPMAIST